MNEQPRDELVSMNSNKLAVSLALADTNACLETLHTLAPLISLAEIRLDAMTSFDLPRLIASAPCPLILTCRPPREGSSFSGPENERLAILTKAMDLGCAYIDIEWDSLESLTRPARSLTKIIVSRHWHEQMPAQLWPAYAALRGQADVVKLVGLARRPADMLPVFDLLQRATSPVIALAMGEAGQLTRLLAPCFSACFLTYAAPTTTSTTAAGQLSIYDMVQVYHIQQVGPQTAIHLHLCATAAQAPAIIQQNTTSVPGEIIHIPLVLSAAEASVLAPALRSALPHLTITADPVLAERIGE